jgi:hypothetical protein
MENPKVYDVLAEAFKGEGVEHLFTLMGDANMYWAQKMADEYGVNVIHARQMDMLEQLEKWVLPPLLVDLAIPKL